MKECPICKTEMRECFQGKILNKHLVKYIQCNRCRFLQTEQPFWLEEAYNNPINIDDTGSLQRNIDTSDTVSILILHNFDRNGVFVDYAGGHGVFTRLMRDKGFDFLWFDPYCQNIFARGFEYNLQDDKKITLVTAIEAFEHFVNPLEEIQKIMNISKNIIFSTELLPEPAPPIDSWWYYGREHGQHVSFYNRKTLEIIAEKFGVNYYSFMGLQIFSNHKLNIKKMKLIFKIYKIKKRILNRAKLSSKIWSDHVLLRSRMGG